MDEKAFGSALSDAYQNASDNAKGHFEDMVNSRVSSNLPVIENFFEVTDIIAKGTADKIAKAKKNLIEYFEPKPAGKAIIICGNKTKKERVALRRDKIKKGKSILDTMQSGSEKSTLQNSIDRFTFNNKAVERARLSDSVYSIGQDEPPDGWERLTSLETKELGLNPNDFPALDPDFKPKDHNDGFFVELYKTKDDVFYDEKYVLTYRGTQGKKDWKTNVKQGIGKNSEHYSKAIDIASKAYSALGDKLEITGHSAGGGMATAAGIVTGAKTYAFNPAGVHAATLKRAGEFSRSEAFNMVGGENLVDNVVVPGEILTMAQDPLLQRSMIAAGTYTSPIVSGVLLSQSEAFYKNGTITYGMAGVRHDVPLLGNAAEVAEISSQGGSIQGITPSKLGDVNAALNPLKKIDMHGMHTVIAGIEQQKADDLFLIETHIDEK